MFVCICTYCRHISTSLDICDISNIFDMFGISDISYHICIYLYTLSTCFNMLIHVCDISNMCDIFWHIAHINTYQYLFATYSPHIQHLWHIQHVWHIFTHRTYQYISMHICDIFATYSTSLTSLTYPTCVTYFYTWHISIHSYIPIHICYIISSPILLLRQVHNRDARCERGGMPRRQLRRRRNTLVGLARVRRRRCCRGQRTTGPWLVRPRRSYFSILLIIINNAYCNSSILWGI